MFVGKHSKGTLGLDNKEYSFVIRDNEDDSICTNRPMTFRGSDIYELIVALQKLDYYLHSLNKSDEHNCGLVFSNVVVANYTYKIKLKCMTFFKNQPSQQQQQQQQECKIKAYFQQDFWDTSSRRWLNAMKRKNDQTLNIIRLFDEDYIHLLHYLQQCTSTHT
jgi:hypothetical protein